MTPSVVDVRDEIEQVDDAFVNAVKRLDVEVHDDWAGDPGIFVTIVLKSRGIRRAWPKKESYRDTIQERLFKRWPESYPCIDFSAESNWIDPSPEPRDI